jgi:hypothetical protein
MLPRHYTPEGSLISQDSVLYLDADMSRDKARIRHVGAMWVPCGCHVGAMWVPTLRTVTENAKPADINRN